MEPKDYKVTAIEGEYATLTDIASEDTIFIAMALLPMSVDIGSLIRFENFEYTLIK